MDLFRSTVLLVFMLICIYLIVYSANYYNKVHSRILGLLKIFGHTNQEIVVFFVIQLVIILVVSLILFTLLRIVVTPLLFKFISFYLHEHVDTAPSRIS